MDEFSEKQLEQIQELLNNQAQSRCELCMNPERRIQHRQDHELLQQLNATLTKMQGIKWAILRNLLSALVVAGAIGVIAFLWSLIRN